MNDGQAVTLPNGGQVSEWVRRRPAPALRPFVAWYSGYREAGVPPRRHRGLPSPYLTMIVTVDEPLTVAAHPDPRQPPGRYDVLVGGLHTRPALITHDGRWSGIQLGVTPLGARALLGMPAAELAGIDVDAADVLGRLADELHERVNAADTWPGRFAALDDLLSRRLHPDASLQPDVAHAWRTLLATGGNAAIAGISRDVGWTSRYVGGRFRAETGLSPKAAGRVVRFDLARRRLQRRSAAGGPAALADLAAACGYYDQAHLAREFRALAGCPPTRWLAEEGQLLAASSAGLPRLHWLDGMA